MLLRKAAYLIYQTARKAIRAAGLTKAVRGVLGPIAGRLFLRLAPSANRPFSIQGHRMVLASGDTYPPIDMTMGRYEEETTQLVQRLIKPGMVVIDVGAHAGYYTLLAAKGVGPAGKVYAFEPEPNNHALLLKNIELNRYSNIVAEKKAVSDRVGCSVLYLTALDNGRHSIYQHGLPERGSVAVETITLDAFLESRGWPRVNLVKIDVEGAEMAVLAGMGQLLQKSDALNLIVEFNPCLLQGVGVDPLEFLEQQSYLGFNVYWIDRKKGVVPVEAADSVSITDKLLDDEGSINLFCSKQ